MLSGIVTEVKQKFELLVGNSLSLNSHYPIILFLQFGSESYSSRRSHVCYVSQDNGYKFLSNFGCDIKLNVFTGLCVQTLDKTKTLCTWLKLFYVEAYSKLNWFSTVIMFYIIFVQYIKWVFQKEKTVSPHICQTVYSLSESSRFRLKKSLCFEPPFVLTTRSNQVFSNLNEHIWFWEVLVL